MRALAFLVLVFVPCFAADTMLPPAADQQLARDIYKQLIEIKSGFSTGATTPAAEGMAERLKTAGFPDSDLFIGGAISKKGNLVARYHGTGARKPLLLLAHTDVVEAKREDWSMDPFHSSSATAISMAAAHPTTRLRRRSGLRRSFALSAKDSNRIATLSSRSRLTKKVAVHTTESIGSLRTSATWLMPNSV
jgi:hypothetical protein